MGAQSFSQVALFATLAGLVVIPCGGCGGGDRTASQGSDGGRADAVAGMDSDAAALDATEDTLGTSPEAQPDGPEDAVSDQDGAADSGGGPCVGTA